MPPCVSNGCNKVDCVGKLFIFLLEVGRSFDLCKYSRQQFGDYRIACPFRAEEVS